MHNKPLVSILIVAYNPGEYLRKTLESCLDQTYQNTEILILDNNSSENIDSLMVGWFDGLMENTEGNKYKITIPKTKYQISKTIQLIKSTENLGPYGGLNFLLEKAHGDYIAIQDHDDIWHPGKIEKQINFLETHPEYIGCGTKTVMYYEADKKYFEYFLEKTNFFTVHPSLLFRKNQDFWYDTSITEYMCDAYSLKYNLCHGKKAIYNLDESLTLHLIKKTIGNYSYQWYKFNLVNLKRTFEIHSFILASLITGWEIMRKIIYPIINTVSTGYWINPIERIPFRIMGKKIKTTQGNEWWERYIN